MLFRSNTYTAVKDSNGDMQSFDKPLAMNYTHTTAQDRNGDTTYNLNRYMLEYGGFGDMWGIPWEGEGDASAEEQRWYPLFALMDGTQMTDTTKLTDSGSSVKYVVKALDIERKPNSATGLCTGLNVDSTSRPDPGSVQFDDPSDPNGTNYIGARPDPDPLYVIMVDGVLQS